MKVINQSQKTLVLPTGETIFSGQSLEVDAFDKEHHVLRAWLEVGLLKLSDTKPKKQGSE
ncbi:hypothetical protein B0181_10570 [Moraxella caviae]|uniref:Uncharacterized protein n=1 Tax=Moraxella caviae TaxID=34060 RepID=A0A1S9ZUT9_9GAMM|nr:hypothetical protein [Moraxella caviae]OOR87285.1 hypothetical protein B0181_10570 [Moraxella caviae]STZ14049.1 Uncharacterised protein [Moraxella caviae]